MSRRWTIAVGMIAVTAGTAATAAGTAAIGGNAAIIIAVGIAAIGGTAGITAAGTAIGTAVIIIAGDITAQAARRSFSISDTKAPVKAGAFCLRQIQQTKM